MTYGTCPFEQRLARCDLLQRSVEPPLISFAKLCVVRPNVTQLKLVIMSLIISCRDHEIMYVHDEILRMQPPSGALCASQCK